MRVVKSEGYGEVRDAIAHDWGNFLSFALPEVQWVPIPNTGERVLDFVRNWNLDGFILTGGNDIGEYPLRDETEYKLLELAIKQRLPVLGICRGLQVVQTYLAGKLDKCPDGSHIAKPHFINFLDSGGIGELAGKRRMVNSFHSFGVTKTNLNGKLSAFAVTDDGWVEGASYEGLIFAIMWHPEREYPFDKLDKMLIRKVFMKDV